MEKGYFRVRTIDEGDQEFLWDILYIALWDAPDEVRRPRSVLQKPHVRRYVENWGRKQDYGLIALDRDDVAIGAVWSRLDGYECSENFGCDFPCIGLAIVDSFQGLGIGSQLLIQFIANLEGKVEGLRLAVNPKNEVAINLYEKLGFIRYAVRADGYFQMKMTY